MRMTCNNILIHVQRAVPLCVLHHSLDIPHFDFTPQRWLGLSIVACSATICFPIFGALVSLSIRPDPRGGKDTDDSSTKMYRIANFDPTGPQNLKFWYLEWSGYHISLIKMLKKCQMISNLFVSPCCPSDRSNGKWVQLAWNLDLVQLQNSWWINVNHTYLAFKSKN